jgi:hypothetical protein
MGLHAQFPSQKARVNPLELGYVVAEKGSPPGVVGIERSQEAGRYQLAAAVAQGNGSRPRADARTDVHQRWCNGVRGPCILSNR